MKPIRFIVPNTPGTIPDIVARLIGPEVSKNLAQPVVIENKPGAGQIVGYEYVAKQVPADGYTVLTANGLDLAGLPITAKDLRFDPLKDLTPVIGLVEGRFFLSSSSEFPWKTFAEFVSYARANPGKLNYGTSSTIPRVQMEALIRELGLNIVHIPYSGGGPAVQGLVAGQVQLGFLAESQVNSLGGKIRTLAVTGDARSKNFPDVPTFRELGYPQLRGVSMLLNVPAGTPKAAIDKLHAAASKALQQADVRARFEKAGFDVVEQSPEAAAKSLVEASRFFAEVARKAGIQPE
jgi:tripartite-type tricarboxylate transporter receptor subunit TctC